MNVQLIIDQLAARASALEAEITLEEQELLAYSNTLKEKAGKLDGKRERRQNYLFAIENIKNAESAGEQLEMMRKTDDPWGDAG